MPGHEGTPETLIGLRDVGSSDPYRLAESPVFHVVPCPFTNTCTAQPGTMYLHLEHIWWLGSFCPPCPIGSGFPCTYCYIDTHTENNVDIDPKQYTGPMQLIQTAHFAGAKGGGGASGACDCVTGSDSGCCWCFGAFTANSVYNQPPSACQGIDIKGNDNGLGNLYQSGMTCVNIPNFGGIWIIIIVVADCQCVYDNGAPACGPFCDAVTIDNMGDVGTPGCVCGQDFPEPTGQLVAYTVYAKVNIADSLNPSGTPLGRYLWNSAQIIDSAQTELCDAMLLIDSPSLLLDETPNAYPIGF